MRQVYAHQATLVLAPGTDPGAPGAAVSGALRGPGGQEPPCYTTVTGGDDGSRVRVLFATEPHRVDEMRARIDAALAGGEWRLIDAGCARLDPSDRPHGRRLLRGTADGGPAET